MTATIEPTAFATPAGASLADEFDDVLVCESVTRETHDVATFVLRHEHPVRYAFEAGQHVTVTVDVGGARLSRCYTIASSPCVTETFAITVKRVPGGPVSNWLHDHLGAGGRVRVTGPLGMFTRDRAARRLLLLSAGSGITPLMAMLREIRDRGEDVDVVFAHCARTPDDLIFRAELARTEVAAPGVRLALVCEDDGAAERWRGPRGRLTRDLLRALVPDADAREVYTCGPAPFMDAAREHLRALGLDPSRCHEESFLLEEARPDARAESALAGTATYDVELRRSGVWFSCDAATTVLQAASAAGVTLPSSCTEGICGTCKSVLLAGTVDMHHQGGIRPREIAQGRFLPCCSTPTSDVVVDV